MTVCRTNPLRPSASKVYANKDIQFLVECLSEDLTTMLMETYALSLDEAADKLYNSHTYSLLENEQSGLYYQGSVYVFDMLREELGC